MKAVIRIVSALALSTVVASCGRPTSEPGAPAPAAAEGQEPASAQSLVLSDEQREQAGIERQALQMATIADALTGPATVLGREVVAQSLAELTMTQASAEQSAAALKRIEGLRTTPGALGDDVLDTARRQASVDAAQRDLARRKLAAQFGDGALKLESRQWEALADGRLKLLRVVIPDGESAPRVPRSLRFVALDSAMAAPAWRSTAVWSAPAESGVPGLSLFAVVAAADLAEGARVLARWDAQGTVTGPVVPAAAVVMHGGELWCFIESTPGHYERKRVSADHPTADGYVQVTGYQAGESVVLRGAGLLLAREFGAAEGDP